MTVNRLYLGIVLTFLHCSSSLSEMRLVCYYANWSVYRYSNTPILYPDAIDPSLCTHIHVAFALINPTTLNIEPSEKHDTLFTDVFNTPLYTRMYKLKRRKSSLKLLVAVGGWTAASEAFNNVIHNDTTRATFIRQTKEFLYEWNFDGIDLDWEFPGDSKRGATKDSKEKFNILIKEMYDSFQEESTRFLITAAVSADPKRVDRGYVVPDFCQYLDYVSIMTYDYHGAWDNVTGINAPLFASDVDDETEEWKNVNHSMQYWLNKGCPAKKLNLGLATYGRTFTLVNGSDPTAIGSESSGPGSAGPHTKEEGTLAYFEVCQKVRLFNWTSAFDIDAQAPYAYSPPSHTHDQQWVGYDDTKSLTAKVLYAKKLGLGGTMIWSLDQDDYTGKFCNQGTFPLTRHIHNLLFATTPVPEISLSNTTKVTAKLKTMSSSSMATSTSPSTSSNTIPSRFHLFNRSPCQSCSFALFVIALFFSRI